jgi:di/tricarboxylate transporter
MKAQGVLHKLTPRNMTVFGLANLAMGATYFISAPPSSTGGPYAVLEPIFTARAEAIGCNDKACPVNVCVSGYPGSYCEPAGSTCWTTTNCTP